MIHNRYMNAPPLLKVQDLQLSRSPELPPLQLQVAIPPGLTAVTGGEQAGKTTLLKALHDPSSTRHSRWQGHRAAWLDLSLPGYDQQTAREVWASFWANPSDQNLQTHFIQKWDMAQHIDKPVYMLSKGHRRKVGLVALLAANHPITCLDMPYAALDLRSIAVLRAYLKDAALDATRAWVIADYEADEQLTWTQIVSL